MRRFIGRILAWFLRAVEQDEYVQIQKAAFVDGRWRAQVRVFTKDGTIVKTVHVDSLSKPAIREAANGD